MTELLHLSRLDILGEIEILMAAVTDAQLLRHGAKMPPKKKHEKPLGTVHNDTAKRAYVAHLQLKTKFVKAMADAQAADDETGEDAAHLEAHKASEFADLLFEMTWSQIRSDMNSWCGIIALRHDWLAVTWDDEPGPQMPDVVKRMLGIE